MKNNQSLDLSRQLLLMQIVVETLLDRGVQAMGATEASRAGFDLVEFLMQRYAGVPMHALHRLRSAIREDIESHVAIAEYLAWCREHEEEVDQEYLAHFDEAARSDEEIQGLWVREVNRTRAALGLASQVAGRLGRTAVRSTRSALAAGAQGVAQGMARTASRLSPGE